MFKTQTALATALLIIAIAALAVLFHPMAPDEDVTSLTEAEHAGMPTSPVSEPISSSTKTAVVPIVVYHIVRPSYPTDSAAVRALAVTPQTFDAQLAHLQSAGYHIVGFHALESYFASSTPLPTKPVILSFDDGWRDQYEYAFPILEKYHDTATFFIFTNELGHKGAMSVQDLKDLVAAGMTIGDHTESHPFLTKITDPQKLWNEIDGSKTILQNDLGTSVTEFAYPFGQYNPAIISLVHKAGYLSARGDYWSGNTQSTGRIYELSALNVPTTTTAFVRDFP